jgi:hypothetical protein
MWRQGLGPNIRQNRWGAPGLLAALTQGWRPSRACDPQPRPLLRSPATVPAGTVADEWGLHRRRSTRRYVRRTAVLADIGRPNIRCRIADISAHGMRLLLPDSRCVLPANFTVIMVESGALYRVRNVWRNRAEVGVELQASEMLLSDRTEQIYHEFMRRVQNMPAGGAR